MNYNKMILIGHLVQNPEVKQFPSGDQYVVFSVGYNQNRKMPDGNWRSDPYFFDVEYTGKLVDVVAQNKKGDGVLVEGILLYREYQSEDGSKKRFYTLKADKIVSLMRKETDQQPPRQQPQQPAPQTAYPPQTYPQQSQPPQYPPPSYPPQYPPQSYPQQPPSNPGQCNGQYYEPAQPAFSSPHGGVPF